MDYETLAKEITKELISEGLVWMIKEEKIEKIIVDKIIENGGIKSEQRIWK